MSVRGILASVLSAILASGAPAQSNNPAAPDNQAKFPPFNYGLATQTFGVKYQFTGKTKLVETAEAMLAMGSNVMKCHLGRQSFTVQYGLPKNKNIRSLVDLVRSDPSYQKILEMPFDFYLLWAYPFSLDEHAGDRLDGMSSEEKQREYHEIFELTCHLLETYSGTGKSFYLGNWEGDWQLLGPPYDGSKTPTNTQFQGMVDWMAIRQLAVEDARKATPHHDVAVYHYTEVNLARKSLDGGRTMISEVLPKVDLDYVSYSSYDALWVMNDETIPVNERLATMKRQLRESLDHIEAHLLPKDVPGKRVILGEYGFPLTRVGTPELQDRASRAVMRTALEWGCPFILYWAMYCNEDSRGFWLIDDKNQKQPVHETHRKFLTKARSWVANFRTRKRRNPTPQEYRGVAADWIEPAIEQQAAPAAVAGPIVFDLDKTQQEFMGFGSQVWLYNDNPRVDLAATLKAFNIRHIRVVRENASWEQAASVRAITDPLGIRWLLSVWSAPNTFRRGGRLLQDVPGFAKWWAEQAAEFDSNGMRPHDIDLMNEPDSGGGWSTGISPEQYNELVKLVRKELDNRGLQDVGIVGPGVTHLNWERGNTRYFEALDDEAVAALRAFSTHSWDDGDLGQGGANVLQKQWPCFADAANAKDPTRPKYITEYATKERTFHGVTYPHPDGFARGGANVNYEVAWYAATSTMPFAVRVFENTLAFLNNGANALFIWQLVDEPTEVNRKKKAWGMVDLNGRPKPVYHTMQSLCSRIPVGARAVQPPPQSGAAPYAAALVHGEQVVIALANDSTAEMAATIELRNAPRLTVEEAIACIIDRPGDHTTGRPDTAEQVPILVILEPGGAPDVRRCTVKLPADSTLTIVMKSRGRLPFDRD